MSSNHKAPLAAFVVVAIACVVVLATNSMRSYARDAWRSFAAPVVSGFQLIESPVDKQPAAPAVKHAPVAPSTHLHRSVPTATLVISHHDVATSHHVVAAVHAEPKQPVTPVHPVVDAKPTPSHSTSHGTGHSYGNSSGNDSKTAIVATPITSVSSHDSNRDDQGNSNNGKHLGWGNGNDDTRTSSGSTSYGTSASYGGSTSSYGSSTKRNSFYTAPTTVSSTSSDDDYAADSDTGDDDAEQGSSDDDHSSDDHGNGHAYGHDD